MQKIPLQAARPDMVLAKPVTRDNGMVLVAAGTVLTDSLINRLENMDVAAIVVEGNPVDLDGSGGQAVAKKMERLDRLFRNFQNDPYMGKVKKIIGEYYQQQGAFGGVGAKIEGGE